VNLGTGLRLYIHVCMCVCVYFLLIVDEFGCNFSVPLLLIARKHSCLKWPVMCWV